MSPRNMTTSNSVLLPLALGADQDVEAVEPDVHVAEAAVVEGLDATDHGLCL